MRVQLFHYSLSLTSSGFSSFVRDIYLPSLKVRSEYDRLKDRYLIAFPFAHIHCVFTQVKAEEGLKLSHYKKDFSWQARQQ